LLKALLAILLLATPAYAECGIASWYSYGTRTASGERFNPRGLTAAHKKLPFGTRVIVTVARTGKSLAVRINDRGPFIAGRIIDLARGAAEKLGIDGLASVCIHIVPK
jgi:rare lipoprotein A